MTTTNRPATIVVETTGTDDRIVRDEGHRYYLGSGRYERLPVWYRAGSRAPRPGERLPTWVDVSTRYIVAPMR